MFHIALFEPRIAPNTGNIIRLSANTGAQLHLIEPLGFSLENKQLRRAGLDYHDLSQVSRYADFSAFTQTLLPGRRLFACTTKGYNRYDRVTFQEQDILLFGSETSGLPDSVLESVSSSQRIRIPMRPACRSLNLANAVAIINYEAWRQLNFPSGQ